MRELPVAPTAAAAGIAERTLKDLRAGRSRPHSRTRTRLVTLAAEHARERLTAWDIVPPREAHARLARYLEERVQREEHRCVGCEKELAGRQRRWCRTCRKSGAQRRKAATKRE